MFDKMAFQSMINSLPKKPKQPVGHESKCPCSNCEHWANDLIDWQHWMLEAGHNPFAR